MIQIIGKSLRKMEYLGVLKINKLRGILILLAIASPLFLSAQQTITLEECFELVTKNYPLAKKVDLLKSQNQLDIETINKGKLPSIDLKAQATYQSDVTSLPIQIPNITVDVPNKDQYRAILDVNQLIYNGGVLDASAKVTDAKSKVGQQEVEVTLYALKSQINQLYFSVLLIQENRALLVAKEKQLLSRLDEVRAGVKFGMLLPTSSEALEVELLKIKQNYSELDYSQTELIQRISLLIGRDLDNDVILQSPDIIMASETGSVRPELILFELQKEQIDYSTELLSKSKLPKISAFAQGGYGNPGLNMLDNSFTSFYMSGVRLNWNVFDWNKTRTEKQSQQINKAIVDNAKETFEINNNLELVNLQSEIDKMDELIAHDQHIINLREKIVKTAESQLKNGVITASAYITEFTNLYESKSNMALHKTQLLLKKIQYQITKGTYNTSNNQN